LKSRSPSDAAGLQAWHASTVPGFNARMHEKFPAAHLPKIVMFYLHDADIRLREPAYRAMQEEQIDALIEQLERGCLPAATHDGCAISLGTLGAGALVVLMALLAVSTL